MPHHPNDNLYPHLGLIAASLARERRRRPVPPTPPPPRGGRHHFADELLTRIDQIGIEVAQRPQPAGISAHLVFRIPFARGTLIDGIAKRLAEVGLTVVSIEPNQAVVAFKEDADLIHFRNAIASYRRGPRIDPATNRRFASTKWDLLEYLHATDIRLWSREDRIGPRLRLAMENDGIDVTRLYKLDVELWHPGTAAQAEQLVNEIGILLQTPQERIFDRFVGREICILRVGALGETLNQLLEITSVAEVELPPIANFDPMHAAQATQDHFPIPPTPDADGPRVCILDSGISMNHPLLRANVGHAAAILTEGGDAADQNGHGTMVAGLAVFGDIRDCYENGLFESPINVFSGRVLNDNLQFDDNRLIITQIRTAVMTFIAPPHNCRVFNLSLGSGSPAFVHGAERQPIWAETLDIIAREFKVLFVVAAGNNRAVMTHNSEEAEAILQTFPASLFDTSARLDDPATSAIAITVGSLAQTDMIALQQGTRQDDIAQTIARSDCPSPFTRTGPGIARGLKPEFVDYGGNLAIRGFGAIRRIAAEPATSTMSLSHEPTRSLFAYDVGTSFAVPRTARKAALAWHALSNVLQTDPDPNLVRALLAVSASVPANAQDLLSVLPGPEDKIARACGYGLIDLDLAMDSADRRVCLVKQDRLILDSFKVYEVPVPAEFCSAPGRKTISVSLAFDPPVRKRRAEYLGVEMSFRLIRGKTLDQIVDAYRQLAPNEEPESAINGRNLVKLEPAENSRSTAGIRKKSTLQKASHTFLRLYDYGETYYLVVRAERKWAPLDIQNQDYGLVVTLSAEEPRLYQLIRERIQAAVRVRARA